MGGVNVEKSGIKILKELEVLEVSDDKIVSANNEMVTLHCNLCIIVIDFVCHHVTDTF